MATTSLWHIEGRLKDLIAYVENPEKTRADTPNLQPLWDIFSYVSRPEATEQGEYVSTINCLKEIALQQMILTKKQYGKENGYIAWHGYQSFKPDEITPELAHQIGLQTAKEMWGDKYQIIVTTHLDKDHLHNHFCFNSVSFLDGKKYNYKEIMEKLKDDAEKTELYLKLEEAHCLYYYTASKEDILGLDEYVRPLYEKTHKPSKRKRIVDFNQGIDSRLITEANMDKLSEVNIYPLRIAFDHWKLKDIYEKSIRTAVGSGIKNLSNYLLYNFEDKPEELYHRLRMNVDLCEELGASIYSFPMKYHPINDKEFFMNRDYIGKHWNRKFIRAVQAVLNSTKGKIGRGVDFFEEAFGRDVDEFMKILWMPETFIIYRRIYDADLRNRLADRYTAVTKHDCDLTSEWWNKFKSLEPNKLKKAKSIIALNKFKDGDYICDDKEIIDVLAYYKITRDDTETNQ